MVASELAFGVRGEPTLGVPVDGGTVQFRGAADKIDERRDGTLLVTDIKSGSARRFKDLSESNPDARGEKLQLPVYAHAARAAYGDGDTPVEALYWFVRRDRGRVQVPLTDIVQQRYAATVGALATSLASGAFPQRAPEKPDFRWVQCTYCNPDGLGHAAPRRRWEAKRLSPELVGFTSLVEPDVVVDRSGDDGEARVVRHGETLADSEARHQIRHDTDSTLFVEAGAGSGKTTALVSRVQTLVLNGGIAIEAIAAVTFTERAAAELRDRLRARLEQAARHEESAVAKASVEAALDGLDLAAIGTLHAFAQRILAQHPIEAGIPPLVEVLDEVSSSVAFEGRWAALRNELLDSPEMAGTLEMAFAVGIKLEHVRSLIAKLNADWDLVHDHIVGQPASPGSEGARHPDRGDRGPPPRSSRRPLHQRERQVSGQASGPCGVGRRG